MLRAQGRASAAPLAWVWRARGRASCSPISTPKAPKRRRRKLNSRASESLACQVDVSQADSVENLKELTLRRFGRIDILVNNAGIYPVCSVSEMTEELWDRVIDTNLGGNFLCSRAVVPSMRSAKAGRIISVSSTIGYKGAKHGAHYAASKAGIIGFVKALAREVAQDGITVNAICPGVTDTAQPGGHRSEEELMSQAKSIPLGRIGQPERHGRAGCVSRQRSRRLHHRSGVNGHGRSVHVLRT